MKLSELIKVAARVYGTHQTMPDDPEVEVWRVDGVQYRIADIYVGEDNIFCIDVEQAEP